MAGNLEDKSLSVGNLSNIQFFPSNSEKGTRLPIYKKWTMGPIYLPVKSLQAVSNINLSDNLRKKNFCNCLKIFILPLPWLVCLSVKAQRVSALRGGAAKYIWDLSANTLANIWPNNANTKLEHKYKYIWDLSTNTLANTWPNNANTNVQIYRYTAGK